MVICGGLWSFLGGLWSLPVLVTTIYSKELVSVIFV